MPPFNKMPPKKAHAGTRTGLLITFPKCEWCDAIGAHKCKGCDRLSCYNCVVMLEGNICQHYQYKPVVSLGWGEDCSNVACSEACTLCGGKGVIIPCQR